MNQFIGDIESIVKDNFTIKHSERTLFDYFTCEDYPALCLEPVSLNSNLQGLSNAIGESELAANLYYVEKAPESKNITAFINQVTSIIEKIRKSRNLNRAYENLEVNINFLKTKGNRVNYKGNANDFVAKIEVKGER